MTALFLILYISFFIYLNYSIFKSLNSGFAENKRRIFIVTLCLLIMIAVHFFFYSEGMFTIGEFCFLLYYSFGMIILHYMCKFMLNRKPFSFGVNPKLRESKNFILYEKIVYYMLERIFPIMVTFFQIIVIFNPEIGVDLNKN